MSLPATIEQIKTLKSEISDGLSNVGWQDDEATYGGENEYKSKSLLGGIKGLMTDVSVLTKAPAQFLKLSTHSERTAIVSILQQIQRYLGSPAQLANQIDQLKIQLRPYCTRTRKEWFEEIGKEADTLIKKQLDLDSSLEKLTKLLEEADEHREALKTKASQFSEEKDAAVETIDEKISALDTKHEEQEAKIETVDSKIESLETLISTLEEKDIDADKFLNSIQESQTSVSSNEKLIANFSKNVSARESAFNDLVAKTDANTTTLNEFQTERGDYLKQSEELIKSAKLALEYKTAEGLSAAFSTEKGSYEGHKQWLWIVASGISLLIALGLGFWVVWGNEEAKMLPIVIGRIALIPLPLAAAWFCAGQYVKKSNLQADYGYKMTLAKSLVGFSEELKKNGRETEEEYRHYIKTVLEQIHQDPLRDRTKKTQANPANQDLTQDSGKLLDLLEKFVKISGTIQK